MGVAKFLATVLECVLQIKLAKNKKQTGVTYLLLMVHRRVVALFLIGFAVLYWARIVGLPEISDVRFDTMTEPWQAASVVLAVTMPVAAIGLWCLFPWGTSTWLFIVLIELTMYLGYPQIFGDAKNVVLFHLVSVAIYLALKSSLSVSRLFAKRSKLQRLRTN